MTEPDSVQDGEQALKPWPLHERVVKALKGFSPFGLLLGWGIVSPLIVLAVRMIELEDGPREFCGVLDLDCMTPLEGTFWITVFGIVPVIAGLLVLILLLTLFRAPPSISALDFRSSSSDDLRLLRCRLNPIRLDRIPWISSAVPCDPWDTTSTTPRTRKRKRKRAPSSRISTDWP